MQLKRYLSYIFLFIFTIFATQALAANSSRRIGSNENVSSYGVSKDYNVMNTWEAWSDRVLTSELVSETLEIADDQTSYNDYISAADATVNNLYKRTIRPASGAGHDGTPNNGVTFHRTSDGGVFFINEPYFQVQDMIATITINSGNNRKTFEFGGSADEAAFIGNIAWNSINDGAGQAIGFIDWGGSGKTNYMINNLNINSDEVGFQKSGAGTGYFYNNTSVVSGTGFNRSGGTAYSTNNISTGNGTDWSGTWTTVTSTAENDTIVYATGANNYHLTSEDTTARDQGTSLLASDIFSFDDDGDKQTRANLWDIGFDEFKFKPGGAWSFFAF